MEPAWIVQAAGSNANESHRPLVRFSTGESRTAFGAKAALVVAARRARRKVIAQLSFGQSECRRGHQQTSNESAASHPLAVTAMALERHNWFSRALVAN